eukprot:gene8487-13101_t
MVDAVKHIACPTLLISGDEDAIIPFRNSLRLYALIENTSLAILPFQGHIFWETAPELTSQNLNPFLSMHDATDVEGLTPIVPLSAPPTENSQQASRNTKPTRAAPQHRHHPLKGAKSRSPHDKLSLISYSV